MDQWLTEIQQNDRGLNSGSLKWSSVDLDAVGWQSMQLPSVWENEGLAGLDGIVWFRKEVELPLAWAGKETDCREYKPSPMPNKVILPTVLVIFDRNCRRLCRLDVCLFACFITKQILFNIFLSAKQIAERK